MRLDFASVFTLQLLTSIHLTRYFCFFITTKIWTHLFWRTFHILWKHQNSLEFDAFGFDEIFFYKQKLEILSVQNPPIALFTIKTRIEKISVCALSNVPRSRGCVNFAEFCQYSLNPKSLSFCHYLFLANALFSMTSANWQNKLPRIFANIVVTYLAFS